MRCRRCIRVACLCSGTRASIHAYLVLLKFVIAAISFRLILSLSAPILILFVEYLCNSRNIQVFVYSTRIVLLLDICVHLLDAQSAAQR